MSFLLEFQRREHLLEKRRLASVLVFCSVMVTLFCTSFANADFYDDFSDSQTDWTNWTLVEYGGLGGIQQGGKLVVSGSYDPGETSPNTGGWNHYFLVFNRSYTGYLDISVENTIVTLSSVQALAVGLGVVEDMNAVYDDITSWVQFRIPGRNAIGDMHSWHNGSAVKTIFDDEDVSVGTTLTHRLIVHENRSIQMILNGVTKGWWEIYNPSFYPFIHVGMKDVGSFVEVEFDDFLLVDSPPGAVLTTSDSKTHVFHPVGFDGSESSTGGDYVESYFFDFGDGSTSDWIEDLSTTHHYSDAGTYFARLKVRDDDGKESPWSSNVKIEVINVPPVAYLNSTTLEVEVGEEVFLDGGGSYDPDGFVGSYFFDFGDGGTSGWISDSHSIRSYAEAGEYQVSLLVRDEAGALSGEEASVLIQVSEEPEKGIDWWIILVMILLILLIVASLAAFRLRGQFRELEERVLELEKSEE